MATCLVTGGAKFLGSHLCDEMRADTGRGLAVNIEHTRGPEFTYLNTDIIDPYTVDEPVDFVYHLASPASPIYYCGCRYTR